MLLMLPLRASTTSNIFMINDPLLMLVLFGSVTVVVRARVEVVEVVTVVVRATGAHVAFNDDHMTT